MIPFLHSQTENKNKRQSSLARALNMARLYYTMLLGKEPRLYRSHAMESWRRSGYYSAAAGEKQSDCIHDFNGKSLLQTLVRQCQSAFRKPQYGLQRLCHERLHLNAFSASDEDNSVSNVGHRK